MPVKNCTVSCTDIEGVTHSVQLTAESLYEAVAKGLAQLRRESWVAQLPQGLANIRVVVAGPRVEHEVKFKDFESWLTSSAKSPADRVAKAKVQAILASK